MEEGKGGEGEGVKVAVSKDHNKKWIDEKEE